MFRAPTIVGIVNITEDSFSDGGLYLQPERAVEHARELARAGAEIIDLGPASSHPDGKAVSAGEEIGRLDPVLDALLGSGVAVSVDSFLPETQIHCAGRGVDFLNDIQGFPDTDVYAPIAGTSCKLVVMHSVQRRGRATRVTVDAARIVDEICDFFDGRLDALVKGGITSDRIVLDPGMGFFLGVNADPSITVLRNLSVIRTRYGLPMLVSVSRKSFLGAITGREAAGRGAATLAAEIHAAQSGVDYIRTHDVRALRDALVVMSHLDG